MGRFKIKNIKTDQLKHAFSSIIVLAALSLAVFYFLFNKQEKVLLQVQKEKEEFIAEQTTALIALNLNADSDVVPYQNLERILSEKGVLRLLITTAQDSIIKEINLAKKNKIYQEKNIREFSKSFLANQEHLLTIFCKYDASELNERISNAKIEIGLISLLISVVYFLFISISRILLTKNLKYLSQSAKRISSGSLGERVKYRGKNTAREIAHSVNLLAEDLQKANLQIEKLSKELKFQFKDKIGELNYEINKKRQVEVLLRQSEEQFRLLFELAPIGMVISALSGSILKVNTAYRTILDYDEKEILKKKTKDFTHPDDQAADLKHRENLIEFFKEAAYYEKRMIRKDGEIIYVIVEAVVVRNKEGKPNHIIEQVIDITQRKLAESELIIAKEKAEESDRLKSAFLAQMSHEIRTPLNVILTAMNLIKDDMEDVDEDNKMLLDSVSSAGERLQRTIDLILNISAVQSGSYELDQQEIYLDKELIILVEEFEPLTRKKNLQLTYNNTAKSAKIVADHYSVTQILQNLIGNAVKYTFKGKIEIVLEDYGDDKVVVHVKDTGIGISEEYLANLFTPFSQEDVGQKREFDGNGLGLALVKKYVEINDAEILVDSEKDKGSTFTVIFKRNPSDLNGTNNQATVTLNDSRELA